MAELYGNNGSSYWRVVLGYDSSQSETTFSVWGYVDLHWSKHHSHNTSLDRPCYVSGTNQPTINWYPTGDVEHNGGGRLRLGSYGYSWERGTSDYVVAVTAGITHTRSGPTGTSTATAYFTVPARTKYAVTLRDDNGVWKTLDKFYDYNLTLPTETPTKQNYSFKGWAASQGGSVAYNAGSTITVNSALTLYPVWQAMYPPEWDTSGVEFDINPDGKIIKNRTAVVLDVRDVVLFTGRHIEDIVLSIGDDTATRHSEGTLSITPSESGTFTPVVVISDSADTVSRFELDTITVEEPLWECEFTVQNTSMLAPDTDRNGFAIIQLEKYNYATGEYDLSSEKVSIQAEDDSWSFKTTLDEAHISGEDGDEADVDVRLSFNHSVSNDKEARKIFFNTTRNANYSNGISNTMFVSGCEGTNYNSRVWWSQINNPLYFPDTNYVEVGSNDTSVQGLCKVGDYLGVVKQSKTTDTAIYLLYPTSFDDETTYAVKQGVSGVGAVSKYSFNVLGDESLFLSPQGVMAIVPSEDEEHKVQNRSFFIDGRLLEEDGLTGAYSFVYDGMYWLALGDSCYVLDGNQRNSWGNDKTNLVYEGYYLKNIPATCFMKHEDGLWFSNENALCRFKNGLEASAYSDTYDIESDEQNVPVKAEWSTILDDDGSLHYLKTMQKKGNIVSILPVESGDTSAEVYIKKDAEEPIFVGEVNGQVEETGDIPNELVVRKKIKKYKRLQFIIRNNKAEGLGIDNITKSYVVGNYVK